MILHHYFSKSLFKIVCIKWGLPNQQCKQQTSKCPSINGQPMVRPRGHLRRDEIRCPTHRYVFISGLDLSRKTKVTNFNLHVFGDHKVGKGEVSMHDGVLVQVLDSGNNLVKYDTRFFLGECTT